MLSKKFHDFGQIPSKPFLRAKACSFDIIARRIMYANGVIIIKPKKASKSILRNDLVTSPAILLS
ncbi:UNVERIFIED_CONTAM: hypothetical protein O8I53_07765 [Campylobacter lari]